PEDRHQPLSLSFTRSRRKWGQRPGDFPRKKNTPQLQPQSPPSNESEEQLHTTDLTWFRSVVIREGRLLFSDNGNGSPQQRSTGRKRLKPSTHLFIAADKRLQSSSTQRAIALKKSRRHIKRDHR
ncbi:unnamed protein product, partial [Ectocarpus sp. 8 AP-2014]